jgi:hypothetical protein
MISDLEREERELIARLKKAQELQQEVSYERVIPLGNFTICMASVSMKLFYPFLPSRPIHRCNTLSKRSKILVINCLMKQVTISAPAGVLLLFVRNTVPVPGVLSLVLILLKR